MKGEVGVAGRTSSLGASTPSDSIAMRDDALAQAAWLWKQSREAGFRKLEDAPEAKRLGWMAEWRQNNLRHADTGKFLAKARFPTGFLRQDALGERAITSDDLGRSLEALQRDEAAQGRKTRTPGRSETVAEFRAGLAPLVEAATKSKRIFRDHAIRPLINAVGNEHHVMLLPGRSLKFTNFDIRQATRSA